MAHLKIPWDMWQIPPNVLWGCTKLHTIFTFRKAIFYIFAVTRTFYFIICVCGTNTDVSNLSFDFKYWGLHKFTINPLATYKFWVPEIWYLNSSILRTHNYGVTCVPRSYLALSARCTRTDIFFCMQAEKKAEIIRLEIVGSTVKIYASGDQTAMTFASLL